MLEIVEDSVVNVDGGTPINASDQDTGYEDSHNHQGVVSHLITHIIACYRVLHLIIMIMTLDKAPLWCLEMQYSHPSPPR